MPGASVRRLVRKTQFTSVLNGPAIAHTAHFALHQSPATPPLFDAEPAAWAGVVLPKRWAKRAVTRNALRRHIYVCLQQVQRDSGALSAQACVVRLRRGFDAHQFPSAWSHALRDVVVAELQRLVTRAGWGA